MSQALELAPHRITANCIAPGFIDVRLHPGGRGEEYEHVVELAERQELYVNPLHPYAKALLSAVPIPDPEVEARR